MFPGLGLPMLSVKEGDLIKFLNMTNAKNIAYGELQCEGDPLRAAEMAQFPMAGCFATTRCKFAPGQEPEPPKSAPGGAADPLGIFREPAKPREVFIERTKFELSERDDQTSPRGSKTFH